MGASTVGGGRRDAAPLYRGRVAVTGWGAGSRYAEAIRRDDIVIRTRTPRARLSGAVYDVNYDILELSHQFAIGNWRDKAFFIH